MNMKEKVLFVTILLPYPLDQGGKIKSYRTLRILKEIYDIELLCFVDRKEDIVYAADLEENLGITIECVPKKIFLHRAPVQFLYPCPAFL